MNTPEQDPVMCSFAGCDKPAVATVQVPPPPGAQPVESAEPDLRPMCPEHRAQVERGKFRAG